MSTVDNPYTKINTQNTGIYVTKPKPKAKTFLEQETWKEYQGVFTEYKPGENLIVNLVSEKWPHNSGEKMIQKSAMITTNFTPISNQPAGLYPVLVPAKKKKKSKSKV